jgi:hypothetical protein
MLWALLGIHFAHAQDSKTVDISGYWVSEHGVKVFIPLMRDGRMPVVLMNGKPTVLLGDWDWGSQTLKVNNSRFGIADGRLTMSNLKATQTHLLDRPVKAHFSDGIWFHEGSGELIIADDGKNTWVIQIPASQQASIHKAKWKSESILQSKLDGRCTLDFTYEPEQPDLMWMICPETEHDWVRIYTPSPFIISDWSGSWTSDSGWSLQIDMSGQQFGKVYMESNKRIIDFEASWLGGSQGQSILLERKKDSDAIATVSASYPNALVLRIDGTDMLFYR